MPIRQTGSALGVEGFEYRRSSQSRLKLGPILETLEAWLEAQEKLPAREQRTAQRIYEALCTECYTGAVDTVRRQMRAFERRWHSPHAAIAERLYTREGETNCISVVPVQTDGLRFQPCLQPLDVFASPASNEPINPVARVRQVAQTFKIVGWILRNSGVQVS